MSRKTNIKPVKDLIFQGTRLQSMAKTSQVFDKTDNAVMSILPSMLADNCQTRSYRDNILTLTTHSSAVATQIRYNTPNIISRLKKSLAFRGIERIEIKVVAKPKTTLQPQHTQNQYYRPHVSTPNCKMLQDTANNINSEPLAESLRHLAQTLKNYGED